MEVVPVSQESMVGDYDWAKDAKEIDKIKAGFKGLADFGIVKVPRLFIHPPEDLPKSSLSNACGSHLKIPVIDLEGFESGGHCRKEVVDEIRKAAETWGFFQMINHGIPDRIMKGMIEGVRQFHEQPREVKMELYPRDRLQNVRYFSNEYLPLPKAAMWTDSLACVFKDDTVDPNLLPLVCRKEVEGYMKCIIKLKEKLSELLSEALGLSSGYLADIECMKSEYLLCHYYPVCPELNLTLGLTTHTDRPFLTILLQDSVGGLQVNHQDHWVDVRTIQGALVANIGDLMQLITNDKFKSVEHRVLGGSVSPRISAVCFFSPSTRNISKPYGPIKELLSDNNPPKYREVLLREVVASGRKHELDGSDTSVLHHFKL